MPLNFWHTKTQSSSKGLVNFKNQALPCSEPAFSPFIAEYAKIRKAPCNQFEKRRYHQTSKKVVWKSESQQETGYLSMFPFLIMKVFAKKSLCHTLLPDNRFHTVEPCTHQPVTTAHILLLPAFQKDCWQC